MRSGTYQCKRSHSLFFIPPAVLVSPKGVVHTTGGYLVQTAYTHQLIFNCHEEEIFWCTADIGWITGHSYVVYGPLCNGITI